MWLVVGGGLPWEMSSCEMHPEDFKASLRTLTRACSHEDIVQMRFFTGRTESLFSFNCKWADGSSVSGGGFMSHVPYVSVCFCNPYQDITLIEIWGGKIFYSAYPATCSLWSYLACWAATEQQERVFFAQQSYILLVNSMKIMDLHSSSHL